MGEIELSSAKNKKTPSQELKILWGPRGGGSHQYSFYLWRGGAHTESRRTETYPPPRGIGMKWGGFEPPGLASLLPAVWDNSQQRCLS